MARKRIYMVLVVAMTVGAVFAIGTYRYVQARPANTPQAVNTAKVVVAASNMDEPGRLADFVAANCDIEPDLLCRRDPRFRRCRSEELVSCHRLGRTGDHRADQGDHRRRSLWRHA